MGRCELWTELANATMSNVGYTCMQIEEHWLVARTMQQHNQRGIHFLPLHGGQNQACRRTHSNDDSAAYYQLVTGVESIFDCELRCVQLASCLGIEYNENGRCELWTELANATMSNVGYTCMQIEEHWLVARTMQQHNQHGIHFLPVHGGQNQACRRTHSNDNSAAYYQLVTGVETIFDCELHCVQLASCLGIEYNENGRCELWTELANA